MSRFITCVTVLVLLVACNLACNDNNDILATYKNGKITRGEFYSWLDANKISKETILNGKEKQKKKLKRFITDRLIRKEALGSGYQNNEDYRLIVNISKSKYYADMLKKEIRDTINFKEDIAKVSIIKLLVKDYKLHNYKKIKLPEDKIEREFEKRTNEAKLIIKYLEQGKSFAEAARHYSDDYSKKKDGDIGFIAKGMRSADFSNAVFSLRKGQYTKEPVKIDNGIYIIKNNDVKTVSNINIDEIVNDKKIADKIKNNFYNKVTDVIVRDLKKNSDIETHFELIARNDENSILFKIGNTSYKTADLMRLIDFMIRNRGISKNDLALNDNKLKILKKVFKDKLMEREALKRGLQNNRVIFNNWKLLNDKLLVNGYVNDIIFKKITVTPREVFAFYKKNKNKFYTKVLKKDNKNTNKIIPFNAVQNSIRYKLLSRKKSAKKSEWESHLLKQNDYRIHDVLL